MVYWTFVLLLNIVLNFIILKYLPFKPMRSCLKKTGPLDVNLINIAIKIIIGDDNKIAIIDIIISKVRFNIS